MDKQKEFADILNGVRYLPTVGEWGAEWDKLFQIRLSILNKNQ